MIKIAIGGVGYVGLSLAVLLSQHNEVVAVDIVPEKVDLINSWRSPIQDEYIEKFMAEHEDRNLHLTATTDGDSAYADADFIIIAAPTDYDPKKRGFDTRVVETIIDRVMKVNDHGICVIKSTVPIGFTERLIAEHKTARIMFFPEFLRETKALYDNLYPSRIICGCDDNMKEKADEFAGLLTSAAEKENIPVLFMRPTEAEAVKLFANTYLAMRVAFFNELDTFAASRDLDSKSVINGVCLDPRIGDFYNAPSFGYSGYCLPKDSKALLGNYGSVPQNLIRAIVESNATRKDFIAEQVLEKAGYYTVYSKWSAECERPVTVGIYRLVMKTGSRNFRSTAIGGVAKRLKGNGITCIVYEPELPDGSTYFGSLVVNDIEKFKAGSDVIVANRIGEDLEDVMDKVYSRDLFGRD